MASDPAGIPAPMKDMQAFVWSGGEFSTTPDDNYTDTGIGIKNLLLDQLAISDENPFAMTEAYNPFLGGEPLPDLLAGMGRALSRIEGFDPISLWETHFTFAQEKLETLYGQTEIDAAVDAYEAAGEADVLQRIARQNLVASSLNNVNSSTRAIKMGLLERDNQRMVSKYRAELELANRDKKETQTLELAAKLVELEAASHSSFAENLRAFGTLADLAITANRNLLGDRLKLSVEDHLWDLKLDDFANSAISALTGPVVPRNPDPRLETISTIAGIVGALGPLVAAL